MSRWSGTSCSKAATYRVTIQFNNGPSIEAPSCTEVVYQEKEIKFKRGKVCYVDRDGVDRDGVDRDGVDRDGVDEGPLRVEQFRAERGGNQERG